MTHPWRRIVSCLLSLVLALQLVTPALAYREDKNNGTAQCFTDVVLRDDEGNETLVDESWSETYPYGAFAFDVTAVDAAEGDDTVVTVYRLGGTNGTATAYITYSPLLVANEDGSTYYGYALSADDVTLEVEEPLPIAQYQETGAPAAPEHGEATVLSETDEAGYVLSLSEPAEHYLWQILYNGSWTDIDDSDCATLPMDAEYMDGELDYRCIYTVGGTEYCTDSLKGEAYEKPEPEELEPIPEDIVLNPEPVYTALDLTDGDDRYTGVIFSMTFAEGEWKKELHFHAHTDDLVEAMEAATLRIVRTDGGEIAESSNTLLYHITDRNESTPSTVGFAVTSVEVDQADGYARVMVARVGGNERPVTVEYHTEDGTAVAGKDYVAANGTLMFYGNISELPVVVELIDDGEQSDEPLDFTITLSELKGDDNCVLSEDASAATVSLTNSGTGDQSNLASRLYDAQAIDLSSIVSDSPTAANSGSDPVVGTQTDTPETDWTDAELVPMESTDMSTQSYGFGSDQVLLRFSGGKWRDTEDIAKKENFHKTGGIELYGEWENISDVGNEVKSGWNYGDHVRYSTYPRTSGVAAAGKTNGWAELNENLEKEFGQKYSNYDAGITVVYAHDESYLSGTVYHGSWLVPKLTIFVNSECLLDAPTDTRIEVDSKGNHVGYFRAAGSKNWNVQGRSNSRESYDNPYYAAFKGAINSTGKGIVYLDLSYHGTGEHEKDPLLHNAVIDLYKLKMTRRKFMKNAFSLDIATPNDSNTAPAGCFKITDYTGYMPTVTISDDGGVSDNQVYVGSTIRITPSNQLPRGMSIARVDVLSSTDNGKTWRPFTKFSTNISGNEYTIKLLGKNDKNILSLTDINNTRFKFRVVYQRDNKVVVDLSPSLPRDASGTALTDEVYQLFNNYKPNGKSKAEQNHCFASARITYGFSEYNSNATVMDFKNTTTTSKQITPTQPASGTSWTLPNVTGTASAVVSNLQWINFGLPSEDTILINGRAYSGNATIYLTQEDLVGDVVFRYYHSHYQDFVNPMTTTVSWMALVLDKDGDGKISGVYEDGTFKVTPNTDEFVRYLREGESFNELEIAPVEQADGSYRQYFMMVCYSMSPRCLSIPEGENEHDRAQILPAVTSAVDPAAPAYSKQTKEQRQYNYVLSAKDSVTGKHTSDNHLMYHAEASAKSILTIPLGGDTSPARLDSSKKNYIWSPHWYENNLFSYGNPQLVTIENSLAGSTPVTSATLNSSTQRYEYSDASRKQMNGYLASMTGASTMVLVSQIQQAESSEIKANPNRYPVVPNSVTVCKVRTSPDASYLQKTQDSGDDSQATMPTSGEGTELSEFKLPFDMNLGGNEISLTDYVTILMDENQVGFAVGLPLAGYEKEGSLKNNTGNSGGWEGGEGKNFCTTNKEAWTQFSDFFSRGLGDDTLKNSMGRTSSGAKKKGIKSGKFSVGLSASTAFLWQYNPLDNDYYFSAWEIGIEGELGFRMQARLTPCPALYAFIDIQFSLELKTGLGVIRDTRHGTAHIDAKTAAKAGNAKTITYYPEPGDVETINQAAYNALKADEKQEYIQTGAEQYAKRSEYFARKDYLLTAEQYALLSDTERLNYSPGQSGYYNIRKFSSYNEAVAKFEELSSYAFELPTKAFDIRFEGSLFIEIQKSDGNGGWVPAQAADKYIGGIISSDGTSDTLVVIKQQDEMELKDGNGNPTSVRVVLHPMDHDANVLLDQTKITYLAEVNGIYNQVHWNGITIAPELNIEIGVGVGVELLKAELYLHFSLGAEFLLWGFNENWDPALPTTDTNNKYYCRVDSFDVSIGIAMRAVFLFFTYEMEFASYNISYKATGQAVNDSKKLFNAGEWSYEWVFLNGLVEADTDDPDAGITIRMPANKAKVQKVYGPDDGADGELSTQAYDHEGVPFQLSGYGSAMAAANLTSNIIDGSQFKVIQAGDKRYVVYTLTRDSVSSVDTTMLVMSELGHNGSKYCMFNPADPTNTTTPYITLDNDATGDLDFDVWTDGASVRAAWVSYASATSASTLTPPTVETPVNDAGTAIDGDNYDAFVPNAATAANYEAWHDYYAALASSNADKQLRAKAAAKNTVVKTASWTIDDPGFSVPQVLNKNSDYSYVFQPASTGSGDVVFFASTLDADNGSELTAYTTYLDGKLNSASGNQEIKNTLTAIKTAKLNLFGTRSALNLAVWNGSAWTIDQTAIDDGSAKQTLSNVEFTAVPNSPNEYYVAYTTEQTEYAAGDMVTVHRLYLRKATVNNPGSANVDVDWGVPRMIRELRDFDKNTGKDGVYGNLVLLKEYDSPYLANLKFLTAELDEVLLTGGEELSTMAVSTQTLLSFEMNGASYLIPQTDLATITGTTPSGKVYPFFTAPMHTNADGQKVQEGSSGKLNVDINADASGKLYAVYIGAAQGTTGNALYLSTYDANVNKWGDGVMLAMHDMNTYEAAIREKWDTKTTELAYLYGSASISGKETALTAMYGEDALNTVKAVKAAETAKTTPPSHSDLGDGKTFTFTDVQTVKGDGDTLLAIVQGSTRTMDIKKISATNKYVLGPTYTGSGELDSSQGTYVISFGQGSPALGNGSISFAQHDFGAGSRLYVSLKAENTGTTAFRGSDNQPITATLTAGNKTIATWEIKNNIVSGQAVEFSGTCDALPTDLVQGDTFRLTLSEFTGAGYSGTSSFLDLFTVEYKPDLSVENLTIAPVSLKNNGEKTVLSVDFIAANQGSADAEEVFAQFTYVSGYDNQNKPIYAVLPLQANALEVGQETSLGDLLHTQEIESELSNGKLALYSDNKDGTAKNTNIGKGCGKRVTGTIELPSAAFAAGESKHAEIRVELFSKSSHVVSQNVGVCTANHDEYYTANNAASRQVEAYSEFTAAHNIVIPLGTTTRVPFTAVSSRNSKPVIFLEEIGDDDGQNIGILNFKQSSSSGGRLTGVLSMTPVAAGTGVIHITDTATNSTYSVAFEVTDAADGIDIFKDNDSFSFYNRGGDRYDENSSANQDWSFPGKSVWGSDSNNSKEAPLRQNLSVGSKGSFFKFDSVANRIDLFFQGTVSVSSTNLTGFAEKNGGKTAVTVTNAIGGNNPVSIELGENPDNEIHTLTVSVLSDTASFDRLRESYSGNVVPVPTYDGSSPVFIWSRSFPDTGSVKTGNKIPLKLFILDNSSVASLTVDGRQYTEAEAGKLTVSEDEKLWCYDFGELGANTNYVITATDDSGNQISSTLIVDWFLDTPTGNANTVNVPEYTAKLTKNGVEVTTSTSSSDGLAVTFTEAQGNTKTSGNTFEVYFFNGAEFQKKGSGAEPSISIASNGYYWVRTVNTDGNSLSTWSATVLDMKLLDGSEPQVSLICDGENSKLNWTANKASTASKITDVTIDGKSVYSDATGSTRLSGSVDIWYSGSYELTAKDAAAHETRTDCTAEVALHGDTVTAAAAWSQGADNGIVTADLTNILGGTYTTATPPLQTGVRGDASYKTALLKSGNALSSLAPSDWTTIAEGDAERVKTWKDLEPGDYTVVIKDGANDGHMVQRAVTVANNVLTAHATSLNASGSTAADGKIVVTTNGGTADLVEFAVFPTSEIPSGQTPAEYLKSSSVTWALGDENSTYTASALRGGNYCVAARSTDPAANVKAQANALNTALDALDQARTALASSPEDASLQTAVTNALADCESAEADYQTALRNVSTATAAYYTANPERWDGVYVEAVLVEADPDPAPAPTPNPTPSTDPSPVPADDTSVDFERRERSTSSALRDIATDKNGAVSFTLNPGSKMSASDQKKLCKANASDSIVVKSGGFTAMIPEGTLRTEGFDLNRIMVDTTGAREGMVLMYTDLNGNTSIAPFGVVTNGGARCIILAEGDYRVAKADTSFVDVAGIWGEPYIRFVAARGLLKGTGDGKFSPNVPMSRAMFVTVLWRMSNCPKPGADATFQDLKADWYKDAVAWAVEEGITSGYSPIAFGPNDSLTREQMCVLIIRYLNYLGWTPDASTAALEFSDAGDISAWALDAVKTCTRLGLVNGVDGNRFAPSRNASRMETSAVLTRFVKAVVEQYCN